MRRVQRPYRKTRLRPDQRRGHLLWVFILLMIVLLSVGASPVWAQAADADEISGSGAASDSTAVMSDTADSEDESFEEVDAFDAFDAFEEFEEDTGEAVFDPLSGYNRVMTHINDRLYYWVFKPVAKGYGFLVPKPARKGIRNFFHNLGFPIRMVNNVLQLKVKQAGTETARFIVNTTVGVGGLWDPASSWLELPVYSEDFGQTLGYYGFGDGFPVVLPLLGPSNVRDIFGRTGDWFLDPVNYLDDVEARTAVNVVEGVNESSLRIGQYEAITKDALDLYIFLRDGYRDVRNKAIEE